MMYGKRNETVRWWGLLVAASALIAVLAGCQTPNMSALAYTFESGTYGTTTLELAELPNRLEVAGSYEIEDGSLTATVHAPDGSVAFSATLHAGETGEIREPLVPATGTWLLTVESAAGRGRYDIQLRY